MSLLVFAVLVICLIGTVLVGFDVPGAWAATTALLLVISILGARRRQRRQSD